MATSAPEKAAPEAAGAEKSGGEHGAHGDAPAKSRFGLRINLRSKTVRIVGLLAVIMVVEAVVMSMLLPGPSHEAEEEEAATAEHGHGHSDGHGSAGGHGSGGAHGEVVEAEIGRFSTTNTKAAPDSVIHISFSLVALIDGKNKEHFEEAKKEHDARLRQCIEEVCRSASLADLNEPNLGSIKRIIREEVNKILRTSFVSEVVISEYKGTLQ